MERSAREPKGRDLFACSNALWSLLQDLGRAFGWQPEGTTYLTSAKQVQLLPARHDYHPGGSLDGKRIENDDALAWARALEAARQATHFHDFLIERCAGTEPAQLQTLYSLIYEFTEFAYGGSFTFSEVPPANDEELTSLPGPHNSAGQRPGAEP